MSDKNSNDVVREVHINLHRRDDTNPDHYGDEDLCRSYTLETIVWETLAVLGEWGLIEVELKHNALRRRLARGPYVLPEVRDEPC